MSTFAGGGKRISQETFDDVVRENIEDFEMEKAEALAEAINQFKSQGVDLSVIDLTGGAGREEMQEAKLDVERAQVEVPARRPSLRHRRRTPRPLYILCIQGM